MVILRLTSQNYGGNWSVSRLFTFEELVLAGGNNGDHSANLNGDCDSAFRWRHCERTGSGQQFGSRRRQRRRTWRLRLDGRNRSRVGEPPVAPAVPSARAAAPRQATPRPLRSVWALNQLPRTSRPPRSAQAAARRLRPAM